MCTVQPHCLHSALLAYVRSLILHLRTSTASFISPQHVVACLIAFRRAAPERDSQAFQPSPRVRKGQNLVRRDLGPGEARSARGSGAQGAGQCPPAPLPTLPISCPVSTCSATCWPARPPLPQQQNQQLCRRHSSNSNRRSRRSSLPVAAHDAPPLHAHWLAASTSARRQPLSVALTGPRSAAPHPPAHPHDLHDILNPRQPTENPRQPTEAGYCFAGGRNLRGTALCAHRKRRCGVVSGKT